MELAIRAGKETAKLGTLSDGDAGTAETIAAIQAVIDYATYTKPTSSKLEAVARDMVNASLGDVRGFAAELWSWCRQNVQFKRDPDGVELIRTPEMMLDSIAKQGIARGDCDDLATLASCIIAAAGFRPVLITVGRKRRGRFQHIFFGIRVGDDLTVENILPLDPQENTPAGTWPVGVSRVKLWSVSPSTPESIKAAK